MTLPFRPRHPAFAAALALLLAATAADAADRRPVLRSAVTVSSDIVTIGDLFENAGTLAEKPIFRAPDLGTTGTVPAWRVVAEARAAGLVAALEGNLVEVAVTRGAREVGSGEIQRLVAAAVARQLNVADPAELQLAFDQPLEPKLANDLAAEPVRVASVSLLPGPNRFEALVVIDKGGTTEKLRLRGQATEVVDTLTLTRPLTRGEIVTADDLVVERVPKRLAGAARSLAPEDLVGLAARRAIRAGQPLTAADFTQPLLVTRGETVSIVYEVPGLVLTARGQALEQGAMGQSVTILNQTSKRTVVGVVTGKGRVTIGGRTPVASIGSTRP